jgi:heat shock protein HtpX
MKRSFLFQQRLRGMSRPQIEAVLGREISHVANGDMVTLALLQGVLNTFVIFLARIIGSIADRALFKNDPSAAR